MKNSAPKWLYTVLPILVVVGLLVWELVFVISNNSLPFVNLGNSGPTFSVNQYQVKLPFLNSDKTYTLTLNYAKLEGVEAKKVFLNSYTILHLRPFFGQNGDIAGEQTFDVVLPDNIPSSLSYNNSQFRPTQFQTMVGKNLSLQITVDQLKQDYSVSDVKGWALIYVQ